MRPEVLAGVSREVDGTSDEDSTFREGGSCRANGERGEYEGCCDSSQASSSVSVLILGEVVRRRDGSMMTGSPLVAARKEALGDAERGSPDAAESCAGGNAAPWSSFEPNDGKAVAYAAAETAPADAVEPAPEPAAAEVAAAAGEDGTVGALEEEIATAGEGESASSAAAEGGGTGEGQRFLADVNALVGELERDLDAARVLLPECHRFRKVVGCVSEAVAPGIDASPRQVRTGHCFSLFPHASWYCSTLVRSRKEAPHRSLSGC